MNGWPGKPETVKLSKSKKFYITTPIYYVNDRPHIGHAYTTIAADMLARYHRLQGDEVTFLTGTDENAQKTVDAAAKSGEDVKAYTDRLADIWKSTWDKLDISNTDFIRTTEERHIRVVQEIWKRIWDNGDIYKGKYEGLYCNGHETFMKETDLVDGICPDHKTKPEWIVEENYFFNLKKYEKDLLKFYEDNPDFVTPVNRLNEVKSFVQQGLENISVSREKQKWGIPVPSDPKHVIYVWFDALINYISAVGIDGWIEHPADIHTVGKDIIRFHAVIWPAMLLSAKLPLPRQIMTNGFFTIDGIKISKSLGNAIDPVELVDKYGVDALRYFLLREIPYGEDGDFSETKFRERYNGELANGLGNFAARVLTLACKYDNLPRLLNLPTVLSESLAKTRQLVARHMDRFKFHETLEEIWELVSIGDAYMDSQKPWEKGDHRNTVAELTIFLLNIGEILEPFLPSTAEEIEKCITLTDPVIKVQKGKILFPRL